MVGLNVQVTARGPVFDGSAKHAVDAFLDEAKQELAAQGLSEVQHNLDQSIKFPTPYYETQVTVERQRDDWVVHDRGIIYGPWLEGTGSRNQTTRFKGYTAFRRATAQLQSRAGQIVEHVLRKYLPRMGGS